MRSIADAIRTLRAAHDHADGLRALARAIGFPAPRAVPAHTARALGRADGTVERAVRDDGTAALLLHDLPATAWREAIARAAATLDRTHDPRRWLLLARTDDGAQVVVATWLAAPRAPRIAALAVRHDAILDADAQSLLALAATLAHPVAEPSAAALRWHELLGRTAVTRRVFVQLEARVLALADAWSGRIGDEDRRTLAIVTTARLLFLKFLEAKGWLDGDRDFLARHAQHVLGTGGALWRRLVCPLTFGTLNTPPGRRAAAARAFGAVPFLNGGLFARTPLEDACRRPGCDDAPLAALLLDVLARHRFTAREEAHAWSEAAVDPDMLGRTFEALMHPASRRGSGTFYTPAPLAHELVHDALARTLARDDVPLDAARAALVGTPPDHDALRRTLASRAATLRCLDPACGSGGLLVTALEALATLRHACGDPRALHAIRRDVLAHSIFGVDIAPLAVWLTELRCWLALVLDDDTADPRRVAPLPNLDHNIRAGDALAGPAFGTTVAAARGIATLRTRYLRASGAAKRALARRLDAAERAVARAHADARVTALAHERRELLATARARTLFGQRTGLDPAARRTLAACRAALADARRHQRALATGAPLPFAFATHFADAAHAGGFDVVIGNPPWVRPHRTDAATRATLRTHYAALSRTADRAAFGAQPDVAAAFTLRTLELLRPHGILALALPAKLWRSLAGGALRARLLADTTPLALADFGDDPTGFAAAVYPSTLVARRHAHEPRMPALPSAHPTPHAPTHAAAHDATSLDATARDAAGTLHTFAVPLPRLGHPTDAHAPWRLVPTEVRDAADAIADAGTRWLDAPLPPPTLGCKTGCNAAFLVDSRDLAPALRPWARPALRGDGVVPWATPPQGQHLVLPLDDDATPLASLPAALARHLAPHERTLRTRADLRPRDAWWTVFRTDLVPRGGWRVCWADVSRSLRATLLPPQSTTVPLNSCYGVRCTDAIDALALLALLNAPLTSAFLALVAEPARGGFLRFLGFTTTTLPLPDWDRARQLLAPLAARARRGDPPDARTLHHATLAAYGLRHATVAPLLAWTLAPHRTPLDLAPPATTSAA
jgi:hypothetical protein